MSLAMPWGCANEYVNRATGDLWVKQLAFAYPDRQAG
jgi:hypothetical protein